MPKDPRTIAAEFVQRARLVNDYLEAKPCVVEALVDMKAAGVDERSAITMLSTALTSSGMNNNVVDPPNLLHTFTELEKRKASLPP
jgi:hypothetical protein